MAWNIARILISFAMASLGTSCSGLDLPLQIIDLEDVKFTRFEYQLLKFSDEGADSCLGSIGEIQRVVISRTENGMLLEIWTIEEADENVESCD